MNSFFSKLSIWKKGLRCVTRDADFGTRRKRAKKDVSVKREYVRKSLPFFLILQWLLLFLFPSCQYKQPHLTDQDSLPQLTVDSTHYLYTYHYTLGTNLIVRSDTLLLSQLPIADKYDTLYRGDTVAVAEFMTDPTDSIDSVWVKVAHNQDIQGWIHEKEVDKDFVPINIISKCINHFSNLHRWLFTSLIVVFLVLGFFRRKRRKALRFVFYHDIDSAYPILLCFLMAFCATLYESIQMFWPETWEHFYFNPTLNPLKVPFILSLFLLGIWGIIIVWLAAVEETLKMLRLTTALFYLVGLMAACVICYLFFIFAVHIFIGYPILLYFLYRIIRKAIGTHTYHYRCGRCGTLLKEKGKCPSCGAVNQ